MRKIVAVLPERIPGVAGAFTAPLVVVDIPQVAVKPVQAERCKGFWRRLLWR
jgi:hypothetical protein